MKLWSLHNSTKKGFLIFLTVTWRSFMNYCSPPCFPSSNIMENAGTHPFPMRDVIIEQPHQTIDWNVWGVVQQEIADPYQFLLWRKKLTYHESDFDFIIMGLRELKFDLTSWKYYTSKLIIASHNYLTNMSFPNEYIINHFWHF